MQKCTPFSTSFHFSKAGGGLRFFKVSSRFILFQMALLCYKYGCQACQYLKQLAKCPKGHKILLPQTAFALQDQVPNILENGPH